MKLNLINYLLSNSGVICPLNDAGEGGDHNSSQNGDNCDDDYELDDGKALFVHLFHVGCSF